MSFIKKFFVGTKKEETTNNTSKSQNESTKNDSSNYSKCKAIAFPYLEEKEETLRVENIGLFDGKKLLLDKLHDKFVADVKKYNSEKTVYTDEFRPSEANPKGGVDFNNKEITSLIRSSGGEIIKQVGKKILSGDFNLTTVSFPIKCMIPLSMIQSAARSLFQFPYFMHMATGKDELERFKYTLVASISGFFCSCFFLKPLNPVLGETYEALFSDGSKVFCEQSSHHPPVSHYEVIGPNNSYYLAGFSRYGSSAWINSCGVNNSGKRFVRFPDGQQINFDFSRVR